MSDETARRLPGNALVWTGLLGAIAILLLRMSAPAPRWDLLACVAVTLAGFAWRAHGDRASLAATLAGPYVPAPHPVRHLHLSGRWPILWRSLFATLAFSAACIAVSLAVESAFASVDGAPAPEPEAGLLTGAYLVGTFALWPFVHRAVIEDTGVATTRRALSAVREGAARQLPVQITGWSAAVHRPHYIDVHESYDFQKSGKRPSKRLVGARIPQLVPSLRLSAADGERSLFLDGPVDGELLGTALRGQQGLLHWAPSGRLEAAVQGNSAPALLELGDGRYLRGWTEESKSPQFPQGWESATVAAHPGSYRLLRPVEASVLLQRRGRRPLHFLGGAALLCLCASLLGVASAWEGGAPPLILALALLTAGFIGDSLSARRRRKRWMPASSAVVAPPKAPPPAPTPVLRPGTPPSPPQ